MSLPVLIENLPLVLEKLPDINLVYLFGSRVNGQIGPMSDYDLAILSASPDLDLQIQAHFQHALVQLLNTQRIDVVLLNRAPIELAYHIISTGKPLYQKDLYTRVEYEACVLGKYGDYLPTLRFFNRQILQGVAHDKRVQRYRETLERTQRALGSAHTSQREKPR